MTLLLVTVVSPLVCADPVLDEYYARLAKVSPRDAGGFFTLAQWCDEQNLSSESNQALKRAIRIDPDHAGARKALGYRRYGLGWRLAKDIPKPRKGSSKKNSKRSARNGDAGAKADRDGSAGGKTGGDSPGESSGGGSTTTGEVESRDLTIEERLEKRRAYAKEAAKKSGLTLNTKEDRRGFLIHSTRDSNSKEVKALAERLRAIRKNIVKTVGLRSSNVIWPGKIQIFFLRKLECTRFSETVLDRPFPQNARWETIDETTLLVTKISDLDLTRFMARTSLRFRGGKERWIPSWIEEGIAHGAASETEEGQDRAMRQQAYLTTLSQLENTPDRSPLIDMLELSDVTQRNPDRNRKVALTLLDFLKTARTRRLLKFVDAATEGFDPPRDRGSKDFKNFYIDYFQRQEDVFKSVYRMDLSELDEKWQAFVLERTKNIDDDGKEKSGIRRSKRSR